MARFDEVRNENFYYVDKTMYLPLLEGASKYLFLIRPRRFGKSVFVSMMQAYYDIAKADRFDTLFDGLWIKEHPTPLKNAFQVIYFDFSLAGAGMERLEYTFNDYCCTVLDRFIERYQSYYDEKFFEEVQSATDAADKLRSINAKAHELGYPLYLDFSDRRFTWNALTDMCDGGRWLRAQQIKAGALGANVSEWTTATSRRPISYSMFRIQSKNLGSRSRENEAFLKALGPARPWVQNPRAAWTEFRTYKHVKCTSCHQKVRVPRGKGKLRVTCPRCKTKFEVKS